MLLNKVEKDKDAKFLDFYLAESVGEIAELLFKYLNLTLSNTVILLLLRPQDSKLPCRCSKAEYLSIFKKYVLHDHQYDLWLQRSPVHPGVKVVRHSDYTPTELLKRSDFYDHVLSKLGVVYGASMVVWQKNTWLATATLLRSEAQKDFTNEEMKSLENFQEYFALVFRRIAKTQENKLVRNSLERVIAKLETGIMILDGSGHLIHINEEGLRCLNQWSSKNKPKQSFKKRLPHIPDDIQEAIKLFQKKLTLQKKIATMRNLRFYHYNSLRPQVCIVIDFLPSKTLSISRGTFLIHFLEESSHPKADLFSKLSLLTPKERECLMLLGQGLRNKQVAQRMGISAITVRNHFSAIFQKIGAQNRLEAITFISHARPNEMKIAR